MWLYSYKDSIFSAKLQVVAGLIYVDSATATATLASAMGEAGDEVGGTLVRPGAILNEVTLDCGEGVSLGAEATAFYIALPPQTFENGLTVDVNCKGYKPMSISTSNGVTIDRNHIQPMKEVVFSSEVRTIANNEIWYTATKKIENTSWTFDTFGANIVTNEWDSSTGEGVITFDGDITTIGWRAFCSCDSLTSVTIPDSVTTIGKYAFYDCYSLTSVYCKAVIPPALGGTSVFDSNGSGRKIYVPTESVDVYKSAEYWSEYASAIVGYDF